MKKIFIQNRKNQKVAVTIENENGKNWLVFVMHWLGDCKESEHIIAYGKPFLSKDFVVVKFDTTNTYGESDWEFENATLTNYYEDLEDVIQWSKNQPFYREKFVLLGHSLWAISCAIYSYRFGDLIACSILLSSPINFELSKSVYSKEELENWENKWYMEEDWGEFIVKLNWNYMEDKKKYDLLEYADKYKMPILMIAGEKDSVTPYDHQKKLYDLIPSKKQLSVINNWPHTFSDLKHLEEIQWIIGKWLDELE